MPTHLEFEEAYDLLNTEQKKAVDTIDGPVMVIAGPGTGKTQVLTLRVGTILKKTDIAPSSILCLTFTDAAAINMRERLAALIGGEGYKVAVHTFHGFAREIIASYPEYFYNGADFIAADDLAQLEILESLFEELKRTDPLASRHEEEFTYLKDTKRSIGLLKQAGLSPDDFLELVEENQSALAPINKAIDRVFGERLEKESLAKVAALVDELSKKEEKIRGTDIPTLYHMTAVSLGRALKDAREGEKTAPLSKWKEKWTKKDDGGGRVLKDDLYVEKMRSLARVYKRYRERMYAEKYYDFDDMLLDVVLTLKTNPTLLAMLEERYQYILVDEFQDTNDAQLKLVRLLGSADVNEGRPNIMIVGDDDQAIYRFQGAEISNILDFPKYYAGHTLVVLTKNYRSTQHILDVAREVIEKSDERLEKILPSLEKKLLSVRTELGKGHIVHSLLATRSHEYAYIAREIKKLIDAGANPKDIAVITRRHRELEDIARVLVAANIPITYERKQNVFDEPHIRSLVILARFLVSLVRHGNREADEYLPEILSAPFWGLTREDIWRVSVAASMRPDRTWLGAMTEDTNERVRELAAWLMELGTRAPHDPLERLLDEMIGSQGVLIPTNETDSDGEPQKPYRPEPRKTSSFVSPFRVHYFGKEARERAEARYLMFLSSLRVFIGALRDYKHGQPLLLSDLVDFADIHERNGMTLADTTPFASAEKAVNLMTAHKAKGLEFDTVFVASCQEEVWAGRGYPNKLPFPMNLPIERDEGGDDRLRIFYVALTRAKRHLYVTAYRQDDSGKSSLKLSYIANEGEGAIATHLTPRDSEIVDKDVLGAIDILPAHPEFFPIVPGERAILLELVKEYQMSVTHLNNFLNVAQGGPATFLEQNLLRFPQAMTPASSYGSAMHKAIERFYRELKRTGHVPSCELLHDEFREAIHAERMTQSEHAHFLSAGLDALTVWYEKSGQHATPAHHSEVNFKGQGVVVSGVPIVGKIDKMIVDGENVLVYDFKTGKAKESWEGKDIRAKITLQNYRRQLNFYKLLVENSHDWKNYTVERGVLEFLEPVDGVIKTLTLDINDEETARLTKLIGVVNAKILALDFPDTETYAKDVSGITQFEDDLLSGRV